jgi:Protein of unknown function (DUF2934)
MKAREEEDFSPEEHAQEIAEVAYSYWESRGREDGRDVEDWLTAEQEVKRRHSVQRADSQRHASAA